jgi:hypothetical protein
LVLQFSKGRDRLRLKTIPRRRKRRKRKETVNVLQDVQRKVSVRAEVLVLSVMKAVTQKISDARINDLFDTINIKRLPTF